MNLNQCITDKTERTQKVFTRGKRKIRILFDSKSIKRAIIRMINKKETAYVVGCVAWLSNKDILKALSKKLGCSIVCTKDKLNRRRLGLKPAYVGGAIRFVGQGRGWHKSLMHHKFLVGLNGEKSPIWVLNGSFNMTESAMTNLENLTIMEDKDIAECYFDEFRRVHALSK